MHSLRTHTCGELTIKNLGEDVTLMGWVHFKRNFGAFIFIDLRDNYGLTQIIIDEKYDFFNRVIDVRLESLIQISGKVVKRQGAINAKLASGEIEILVENFYLESASGILPFPIANNLKQEGEDTRLSYRYLDLRTEKMHRNILYRCEFIKAIRDKMHEMGFKEFSTPILTSSSPEGARDFLVPSRLHPGKFYALPQAPQQFKQLLMCAGFDRYYQIAPCFRDEDPRADRAPGEFYQLDIEMSFVKQDDIFAVVENLMFFLFENERFTDKKIIPLDNYQSEYVLDNRLFPCISWHTAMERYGSDKPDLRYALEMHKLTEIFSNTQLPLFQNILAMQGIISAIVIEDGALHSRKIFDEANIYAKQVQLDCLPWLSLKDKQWGGSLAKQLSEQEKTQLQAKLNLKNNSAIVFIIGKNNLKTLISGGKIRNYLAEKMQLHRAEGWAFAWIIDFPMYEFNEESQKFDFSHNPFSLPQCDLNTLSHKDPSDILAFQYDLVCNGIELSSGAIRNHKRDLMEAVFKIAGYSAADVQTKFGALWHAFSYGAPPHGGIAPGIDRMLMLLLEEPNIREVIAFPLNQKGMDLMMGAPSQITINQLEEVHVKLK